MFVLIVPIVPLWVPANVESRGPEIRMRPPAPLGSGGGPWTPLGRGTRFVRTLTLQLAGALGARVFTTAGTEEKREFCRSLGADVVIDYRDEDFVEVVKAETDGAGVDVILDNMGGAYLGRNVAALATEGRLVVIGLQGGTKGELDLNALLRKRGAIIASTLRARPAAEKAAICASVVEHVWPLVADGRDSRRRRGAAARVPEGEDLDVRVAHPVVQVVTNPR